MNIKKMRIVYESNTKKLLIFNKKIELNKKQIKQ